MCLRRADFKQSGKAGTANCGGSGNDSVSGGSDDDYVAGGDGNDDLRGDNYIGSESMPGNDTLENAHEHLGWLTKLAPFLAMLVGFVLAWIFYIWKPETPAKLAANQPIAYRFLLNKWYFDEIYDAIFVRPTLAIGRFLWKRGDGRVIDGFLNGLALGVMPMLNRAYARAQSGYLYTYAFAMVLGIAALVTYVTLTGGAH